MLTIYIVVENGEPYRKVYQSYEKAVADIKEKYKGLLETELEECYGNHKLMASDVLYVNEDNSGITYLYIEKGIHFYIYKLPVTWVD